MLLGHNEISEHIQIHPNTLTTHAAVFGSTGSGKTGLLLGMVEELYNENVPVILVDIKGDMANIGIRDDFMDVRCLTPGGTHGEAVNVLADLRDKEKAFTAISALLAMIGEDNDPLRSTAYSFLCAIAENSTYLTLDTLVYACTNPGFRHLGALSLDDAFPHKKRMALAQKLNTLVASPSFAPWRAGIDLDIDELASGGITVYSVAHLTDPAEQSFAISFLLNEVLRWTRKQSGSNDLRLVLAIDECVGLLPPVANPPTKEPIMLLLKQARAFGVGLVLATQNPVDIDYKAMSNCNTWIVGRMTAERDRARVVSGMQSAGVGEPEVLNQWIAGLAPRQFIMASRDNYGERFKSKDVGCELRGPMIPTEIQEMYEEGYIQYVTAEQAVAAARARNGISEDDIMEPISDSEEAVDQNIEDDYLTSDWMVNAQDYKNAGLLEKALDLVSFVPSPVWYATFGIGLWAGVNYLVTLL